MKVLLIHQYYLEEGDSGGSRWNEMTKVWAEMGHSITVLAGMVHYSTGKKAEKYKGKFSFVEQESDKIVVIRSHVSESYNNSFLGRLWAYFSFTFSSIYTGLFKANEKYDIIIVTSPPLFVGITAYILSVFKRTPFLFEIRDLWPESAIDTGVLKNYIIIKLAYWFEKFIYKKAKKINVLTPAFRDALLQKKNIVAEKICYIPNAADFSLSEGLLQNFDTISFKKELRLSDKFVITYVGAHGVANHLKQLIDVAEALKNENVVFLLIGDGMKKKELKEEVQNKKLGNIIFLDPVPKKDIFKYILVSDIGASILQKNDTFKTVYSNKTFDYMSCKKPILMAIDGVSRKLVEETQSGFYVEPENTQDFVNKILYYKKQSELLNEMGERGYKYAKENFQREELAKRYISIIQTII